MGERNQKKEIQHEEVRRRRQEAQLEEVRKHRQVMRTAFVFERKNYMFMLIGIALIALGFILMTGGGSKDPNVFNPAIYNWQRIRLAPALILLGFAVQVYAILLNPFDKKLD